MLVHELRDYPVEGFLGVDDIAMSSIGGVEYGSKELMEAREATGTTGLIVGSWRVSNSLEESLHKPTHDLSEWIPQLGLGDVLLKVVISTIGR